MLTASFTHCCAISSPDIDFVQIGEKTRVYTCCSRPAESDGCVHGPHVFYESAPEDLHARHGFSFLNPPDASRNTLDVAALDCEMIYTTGGMRVARISIVDGSGQKVFDEFIRMDDGVHVMYVTSHLCLCTTKMLTFLQVITIRAFRGLPKRISPRRRYRWPRYESH